VKVVLRDEHAPLGPALVVGSRLKVQFVHFNRNVGNQNERREEAKSRFHLFAIHQSLQKEPSPNGVGHYHGFLEYPLNAFVSGIFRDNFRGTYQRALSQESEGTPLSGFRFLSRRFLARTVNSVFRPAFCAIIFTR
jgi:hypothetical protein